MPTLTSQTNSTFLRHYVEEYAKAITKNYRDYHFDRLNRNILMDKHSEYAQMQLDELNNGTANLMKFEIREGRSYYKIVQCEYDERRGEYRDSSVHSFVGKVEKNLGNVYKPASWSAPHTKHVRFSFCDERQLQFLLNSRNLDWAGGYLYLR